MPKTMKQRKRVTRVLVVDDVRDNVELYAEYLRFKGFHVMTAGDGEGALELASSETFDIIVMDLALPGVDGWEATRRLKSDSRTRRVPILALSAHVEPAYRERAFAAGCDEYAAKPYLPHELTTTIARMLGERAR